MTLLIGQREPGTATSDFFGFSNSAAWPFVAAANGTVSRIYARLGIANPAAGTGKLGIYTDNAGNPDALLGSGNVVGAPQTSGLFYADITGGPTLVAGTTYWLAVAGSNEQMDLVGSALAGKELNGTLPNPASILGTMAGAPAIWATDGNDAQADIQLVAPDTGAGIAPASAASAWGFGTRVTILPGYPYQIAISAIEFKQPAAPVAATLYEVIFEITTGIVGSEVTQVQIPFTFRNVTAVGYFMGESQEINFPEPIVVPAGTRVSIRVADSHTAALTYSGVKVNFREIAASGVTNITSSDVSGTAAETAVPKATLTGADANGTTTETATPSASLTSSDSSGVATESATVTIPPFSVSDSDQGFSAEAQTLTAAETSSDAGGSSESQALTASGTSADTGFSADTQVVKAFPTSSDQSGSAESQTVSASQTSSDASGSSESAALTAQATGADASGSTAESSAVSAAVTGSDSSGSSSETATASAQIASYDQSGSAESAAETATLTSSDGIGPVTESATVQVMGFQVTDSDTGSSSESEVVSAALQSTDLSHSAEASTVAVGVTSSDSSGPATEDAVVTIAATLITSSDSLGPATEDAVVTVKEDTGPDPGGQYFGIDYSKWRNRRRKPLQPKPLPIPELVMVTDEDQVKITVHEFAVVTDKTALQRKEEEGLLLLV